MSRLGKIPIALPKGVKITVANNQFLVEGPKGKLTRPLPAGISITVEQDKIKVARSDEAKQTKSSHGLVRSVLNSMVKGVSEGFTKNLVSVGVGYRMAVAGNKVNLSLGFSHPVSFQLPAGVTAKVDDQTKLSLSGIDKELLGLVADNIRKIRPPEPYKGKGIRYEGEQIQLKEGKAGAGAKGA
ncbi:MAG: 50S ribosomal protein L6 [Deltaproteobacteria bacterium]|nr:50S ribosomal protein L6 [Deltaproteobacteria bacterium]